MVQYVVDAKKRKVWEKMFTQEMLEKYSRKGWGLVPLQKPVLGNDETGKKPIPDDWLNKASSDINQLLAWKKSYPNCNFGFVPATADLIVLDCDPKNGGSPSDLDLDLPETLTVKTGSGGWHFYFKKPADIAEIGNRHKGLPEGWDVRCDKGQVVLPPSLHYSGNNYEWVDENTPIAELPENVKRKILSNHNSNSSENNSNETHTSTPSYTDATSTTEPEYKPFTLPLHIHQGKRNITLFGYACALRMEGEGMDFEDIYSHVKKANLLCVDMQGNKYPLDDEELVSLSKSACNKFPKGGMIVPPPSEGGDAHLSRGSFSDVINAQRLIEKYGHMLRHNKSFGWCVWDSKVWRLNSQEARIFAQNTAKSIFDEADRLPRGTDEEIRKYKETLGWAKQSLNSGRIEAMLKEASPVLFAETKEFDDNYPWLLNVKNGIVDLKTGELLDHDSKYYMTKTANVKYDKSAGCQRWLDFMEMIFPDPDVRKFVQKAVGYSLTGTTDKKLIFFLYGKDGDNGKSTFIRALLGFFGEYSTQTDIEAIMETRKGGLTPLNEDFYNTRFVSTNEIGDKHRFSDNTIKALSGGDRVNCNPKNRDPFSFDPTHKLWIFGNKKPKGGSDDQAFWNRMMLIAFDNPIPKEKRRDMGVVLGWFREEYSGILNWCLEGLRMMEKEGMERPEKIEADTSAYKKENDVFEQFLENECSIGDTYRIKKEDLFRAYEQFLKENQEKPVTKIALTQLLEDKKVYVGGRGRVFYLGITTQRALGNEPELFDGESPF